MSLMRASGVVKRQFTVAPLALRDSAQAATSCSSVARSEMRRFKHWRDKADRMQAERLTPPHSSAKEAASGFE